MSRQQKTLKTHVMKQRQYVKRYYKKNKNKIRAKQRRYYNLHKKYYSAKHKVYRKQHYLEIKARNKKYHQQRIQLIRKLKSKPCADCGVRYPYYIMEFDHLPQFEKLFNIAQGVQYSFKMILKEASKCEVVCSNCHKERTHKRRGS